MRFWKYVLIPLVAYAVMHNQRTTTVPSQPSGFKLAQTWSAAFCKNINNRCVQSVVADFTIHGLWPYDSSGRSVIHCPGSPLVDKEIKHIWEDLDKAWPSFTNKDNTKFWRHEWEKHGRCSEILLNLKAYFETTLQLKNDIDILKILQDKGIEPNDNSYSFARIRHAIKEKTNAEPELSCRSTNPGNVLLLEEIRLCTDKYARNFVDCVSVSKSCDSGVDNVVFISVGDLN